MRFTSSIVLHGALVYYVLRIPPDCLQLAQAKGVDLTMLQQVLYYCATAVKDFEATIGNEASHRG